MSSRVGLPRRGLVRQEGMELPYGGFRNSALHARITTPIAKPNIGNVCKRNLGVARTAAPELSPSPADSIHNATWVELTEEKQSYPGPLTVSRPPVVPWEDVILFQAFGWDSSKKNNSYYGTVQGWVDEMVEAGITHCWLPPPSHSVSKEGYLPNQLYDLESNYGDHDQLVALNTALLEAGIRPVADIVINHRCADEQNENGVWNKFRDDIPHPGRRIDWGPWAIAGNDPDYHGKGHADSGADYGPSPDLDHYNEDVKGSIADWLVWLRDYIGFEGWRIDFAKGFSPEIAKDYFEESLRNPGKDFCVAEYWVDAAWSGSVLDYNQDRMRQGLCDWMDAAGGLSATFDFPTKALLQEAIKHKQYDRMKDSNGKPPGLMGWWPDRAVTFLDNHDTGSTQQHWPFPSGALMQGYAYLLTHPGIPCIFSEHFQDEKMRKQISELVALRKRNGLKANSKIKILAAESDLYVAEINGNVRCKMGPRFDLGHLTPNKKEGWVVAMTGKDWAVWEKKDGC